MNDGNVNNNNKSGNNNFVWPVRAGEWTPRVPDIFAPSREQLFADLHRSWKRCRRMKRNSANALRFEYRAELNLLKLADELSSGTYRPSRVIRFAVDKPKLREIVAADFRDRVVHHYLVERLEKIYEPLFIHDSYACRQYKGVHRGLERVREFMRRGTKNGTVPLYALHLDVKSYFLTIDRRILTRMIEDRLMKEVRKSGRPRRSDTNNVAFSGQGRLLLVENHQLPFLNHLTRSMLAHDPLANRIDKGDRGTLGRIPPHKSLLHAPFGVGLPVGNLTSQFFANVYLNELDQYCKHTLKCQWYLRYCDDFLILDNDPERLVFIREQVREFLNEKLRLELNTRYAAITDVRNGIDFIGYIIRPDYVLVRRRSINNLRTRLDKYQRDNVRKDSEGLYSIKQPPLELTRLQGVMSSYSGHFRWGNTHRLRRSVFYRYPWLNALFKVDESNMPRPRKNK